MDRWSQRIIRGAKNAGKQPILWMLQALAQWRLHNIKPHIVGVTGSVGKTSTKDALFSVMSAQVQVCCNQRSLNTESGLMLAILEQESGYSSPIKWAWIVLKALWGNLMLEDRPYEWLILEMGADKPGDIGHLLKHVRPQVGVLTNVKVGHIGEGQFRDVEAIFEEKSKLIKALPKDGWAILNVDDERLARLVGSDRVRAPLITYGMSSKSDLRAKHVESGRHGLRFTLAYEGKSHPVHLPQLLGEHQVYIVLPAIAMGFVLGMQWHQIESALKGFASPPGRMNSIEGIDGSLIIDSSYNASPDAMIAALDVLHHMPGRKIAALGSMNELGAYREEAHRMVGKMVPAVADLLITVGEEAKWIAEEALQHGLSKDFVYSFESAKAAGEFLKNRLRKSDVVLVKGSQNNVRMEYCVRELMAEPERAHELLVRQEAYWQTT